MSDQQVVQLSGREITQALTERWLSAAHGKRVLLPESEDDRVQLAASQLRRLGIVPVTLSADAGRSTSNPLFRAGEMLAAGEVDACVAGMTHTSSDVLRAALKTVGVAPGTPLVSSMYLMTMPDGRSLGFADCVVNPRPEVEGLASIAIESSRTFERLTGDEPRVALLSFSTAGSADHPDAIRVRAAAVLAKAQMPTLSIDGEMQFDAAIVPSIGHLKAPGSRVAGNANVLVFPSLEAGNIAYKVAERLAGAVAAGPVMQGLNLPYFDISRGSTADDLVRQCILAAALSQDSARRVLP